MAEVYVTLSEAAELEGVQYQTMARRTQRNKKNFVTKTEKSETGGRDVVLVAVSSLSKQARNAWKEREKLKSFTEEFPDKKEDEQKPEVPWYVNTDVDWYIENYKERYYKAVELGNVVRKFLQYDEGDRTKYAESAISDACAEIDGYLAKRYRVPFTKTPQVINKFAKDISVYNLVSRTGIDESDREKTFLNRYNAAIKFLLDVAKGIISIGVEEKGGSSEAANGFKMKSSGRVFSRDSMRGW